MNAFYSMVLSGLMGGMGLCCMKRGRFPGGWGFFYKTYPVMRGI